MNPLLKKLNLKEGEIPYGVGVPSNLESALPELAAGLPKGATFGLAFCVTQAEVVSFAKLAQESTQGDVTLWVAYPKQSSKRYRCEFNRDTGWQSLGEAGFEPVRQVAIDEDWSALRFRRVEFIKTLTRSFALSAEGKARTGKE